MNKFRNDEEAAYRKLQSILNDAMKNGEDEYSDDVGTILDKNGKTISKFKLPTRLRGWLCLERAGIPPKDVPAILNQTKNTHVDRLQRILIDSYLYKHARDMALLNATIGKNNNKPKTNGFYMISL